MISQANPNDNKPANDFVHSFIQLFMDRYEQNAINHAFTQLIIKKTLNLNC